MEEWFTWDAGQILMWFILALILWVVTKTKELRQYKFNGKLLGSAASLMSWFSVGLYCLVTLGMFLLFAWVIEVWIGRFADKQGGSE